MAALTHYTEEPQLVVPSAAAGASVTPSATAFVNSSWVQLTAGITRRIVAVGFVVNPGVGGNIDHNIDLGTGAATAEVVAGTILGQGETLGAFGPVEIFLIPILIAANTRVSVRMRKTGITTEVWTFKLLYYELREPLDEGIWTPDLQRREPLVSVFS